VEAIYLGTGKYEIEDSSCVDCGCCEDVCPVKAISAE
jgi:formate hydrogenlyase subunit 6/NADH:ubiquinone oxidoreductase subunit I